MLISASARCQSDYVLARPMLYEAFHDVEIYRAGAGPENDSLAQTIVGNICESGDILAKELYDHRSDPGENRNIAASATQDEIGPIAAALKAGWRGALPQGR